jgi:hypothetical protein
MKITHTLTLTVTAVLACGFVYSDDLRSLAGTANGPSRPVQSSKSRTRSPLKQFALADDAKPIADDVDTKSDAPSDETPASEERTANEILATANEKLAAYSSVRVKIAERIAMQSSLSKRVYRFAAMGEYLQGQNLKLKMSIEVKLSPELTARLQEVCDGELLWSSYELGAKEKPEITRRDVKQILQAMNEALQSARLPGREREIQQAGLIGNLGLGGLPALLAGFKKDFEFQKVTSGTIDARDVWIIEGKWNSAFLEAINGNKKVSQEQASEPLPPNIPDLLRISFDKETEFPRRIEYLKRVRGQTELHPLMTLDLTQPKFNERLSRDEFVFFLPNDAKPRDDTQQYIQRISALKGAGASAAPKTNP